MPGIELGNLLTGIVRQLEDAVEQGESGSSGVEAGGRIRMTSIGVEIPAWVRFRPSASGQRPAVTAAVRPTLRLPSPSREATPRLGRLRLHFVTPIDGTPPSPEEDS
jgi:hypothetical protein